MSHTHHDRGKKALNKFSHLFKKNEETADYYRERAHSLPKNDENTKLKHRDYESVPHSTTAYMTYSKAFAFDDDDDDDDDYSSYPLNGNSNNQNNNAHLNASPRSHHIPQTSINMEHNPLASSPQTQMNGNHQSVTSIPYSVTSIESIMQNIDTEKIQINICDEYDDEERKNDGSWSYSYDALQDDSYIYPNIPTYSLYLIFIYI